MPDDTLLIQVLDSLRERGALGEASLTAAVAHAESFVGPIPSTATALLDLGSGGGLPGLVIAMRLPGLAITLTDRRERRTDLVRRACSQLQIDSRVTVLTGDVRDLGRRRELAGQFGVVTARAFGEPLWTLECARPFLSPSGCVIVSEPPPLVRPSPTQVPAGPGLGLSDSAESAQVEPVDDRWPVDSVHRLGYVADGSAHPQVRRFFLA